MTHVCAYMIEFKDGSGLCGLLHRGTSEECWQVLNNTSVISYGGDKEITDACLKVVPEDEWEAFRAEQEGRDVPPTLH